MLADSTQTKEFCEAFAENHFEISYGYADDLRSGFLFIHNHYWLLETDSGLRFHSNESKVIANFFGNKYRTAFRVRFCEQSQFVKDCNLRLKNYLQNNLIVKCIQ